MQELSLEHEFFIHSNEHKKRILKGKIAAYYNAKDAAGIRLPFFMCKSPEKRAEEEVEKLFVQAPYAFNSLYERAWHEYAECFQ